jgi:DNA-binding SARP family transcriptional activator/DNA-binding beta-propeller fold protein YncE
MEFRILGPLEIVDDGRTLELRGPKQRALLTILLLHANEVVSQERLVEDVWGERRPETASTALHGYVSQLRKLLESPDSRDERLLVTRAPGYELRLDAEQLDLTRFERLDAKGKGALATGDAEEAAATLREALSLWRGQPFAEFSAAPFALVEGLRLEELRLSAIEDRIEAELALGRHGALVAELETLVAEHPHRERLWGYLMLALYRSGRQAEALDAYQRTRRALVDELGIEPGTMLQELERAILNHDPSLELPTTVEAEPAQPELAAVDGRRRLRVGPWRALAAASVLVLAVALGLAFALPGGESAPMLLEPNSVGFIDAESGRVTRSYPVGREPRALTVAFDSLWVANYRNETVTRIDLTTEDEHTIPIGGHLHPLSLTAFEGRVWVWTLEELLVEIDPRYDSAGDPIRLAVDLPRGSRIPGAGEITGGGGFLWITAPYVTVLRVDPSSPERVLPCSERASCAIVPDAGADGPVAFREGRLWIGGYGTVFPIDAETGFWGYGTRVGGVWDIAVTADSLWAVSGGSGGGVTRALRRIVLPSRTVDETIPVGDRPVAVALAAGSIWVASRDDGEGTVYRIDPGDDRVVDTIAVGSIPTAIVGDKSGVWVAVK